MENHLEWWSNHIFLLSQDKISKTTVTVMHALICIASLQTQRSSWQSSFRRYFAWSHCLSSGISLSHPVLMINATIWLFWVDACLILTDREEKHLRVLTPSRSFWKRSRLDKCPLSNSCWTHPSCHVISSLKRWVLLCSVNLRKGKYKNLWIPLSFPHIRVTSILASHLSLRSLTA